MIRDLSVNLSDAKVNINFRKTMPIWNFSKLFSNFDKIEVQERICFAKVIRIY